MKKMIALSIGSILLSLAPLAAKAQSNIPLESPTLNRSVRALGMGNAFIASDGGEYSPFYNPAGLNDIKKGRLKFLNMTIDFSFDSIKLIGDALDLKDALDAANATPDQADNIRALDEFVQSNMGDFKYIRYSMDIAGYTCKNFAIGMLIDERLTFSFRDQSYTNFQAMNVGDAVVYVSGAFGVLDKFIQFGATLKPTFRFAMNDIISYDTIIASGSVSWENRLKSVYQDYKFGFGADIGFKSNLNIPGLRDKGFYRSIQKAIRPTLAVTWQDIGNPFPDYKTVDGQRIGFVENEQSVNIGAAVHPKIGFMDTTFEMDFRNLNHESSFLRKFHIGGEFRFPKILALRMGFNQGYIAGGMTLDFRYFIFDFATYAEEAGVYGVRYGGRRLAATLNFGI